MAFEFKLPELGENIESAEVVKVLVNVGDNIKVDQILVEIETDKATVEVPAEFNGVVKEIKVKAGDTKQYIFYVYNSFVVFSVKLWPSY